MDERVARLLELAYRTAPAADANRAISAAREEAAAAGAAAARPLRNADPSTLLSRSYELVIDPASDWEAFAAGALPRLVYHLESVGAHPPACKGVVVAAFVGDQLHFLRAGDLVGRAAELSGISVEELFRRHGTKESRTAVAAPLALPPGGPKS